jgi:phosphodiesterase/alkaline phosphatase D-like protein
MNKIIECYLAIIVIVVVTILTGCKKEKVPVITTTSVSNITATMATSGGNITDEGSSTVITRGVCWSTGTTPTIADNKTTDGAGAGSFSSNITGLNGATVYYVRSYATNSAGTGYGMAMSFTTLGQAPTPTVASATNINVTSATLNGIVNANYLSTVVTFEYGLTTSYGSTLTATQSPVTGNTNTNISADITGLTAATIYHYRITAVNSLGTTNSNDITFTTLGQIPTVTTLAATNITTVAAQLNGSVNSNYLSTVVTFEYGTTTSYGSSVPATQSPVTGGTNTNVSANITGLTVGTTYHYRVKAVNSLGTTNSSDMSFTTLGQVPTVTTIAAINITTIAAQLNGTVNANYLSTVVTFEYGLTTSYGSTVTATQSPVTGGTNTNVSANITGLTVGTTYHYRIKAINSLGTTNGNDMSFTTLGQVPTVTSLAATNMTIVGIQSNGTVNANYLSTVVTFEYGTSISYGNTITATQSPVTGGTNTNVSANITGLTVGTTYHYRVKAVNSLGTPVSDDITYMYLYNGATYQGGLVFYIDGTGQHGLSCAPSDQSSSAEWGCYGVSITGADGSDVGTGNQNTIDIVNGCFTAGIAAKICYDLDLNGYTDWFLPSKGELNLMYTNLKFNGLGGFTSHAYWSSTEINSYKASDVYFLTGAQFTDDKNNTTYVRAVRAF